MRKKSALLLGLFVSMVMSVFSTSTALFSSNMTSEVSASASTMKISYVGELADKELTADSWEATAVEIKNDSLEVLNLETELSISKSLPKEVRIEVNGKPAFVNKTTEVYKYEDLRPSDITTYDIRIYYDKAEPGEIMKGGNFTINAKTVGSLKDTKWKTAELTSSAKISYAELDNEMTAPVIVNILDLESKKITLKANVRDENNVLSTIDISGKPGSSWLENTSDAKGNYQKGSLETYFDYKLESIEYSSEYPDDYEIALISPEVKGGNAKLTKPAGKKIVLDKTVRNLLNISEGQLNFVMVPKVSVPIKVNDPVDDVLIIKDSKGNTVAEVNLKGVTKTTTTVDKYEYDVDVPMSKINNLDYLYNPIKLTGSLKKNNDFYEIVYNKGEFVITRANTPLFKFSELDDGTYSVDGFVDDVEEIIGENDIDPDFRYNPIIPAMYNGKPVTKIGEAAFSNNWIASVVIPDSVTSIGEGAFASNKLTSVVIPNSVTEIGRWAFGTNQLTSVVIPNSVTSIGGSAFYNNKLTSVVIPDSVTEIGGSAFRGNQLTSVVIPDSVTEIGDWAFASNKLTSVVIPDSVTEIGYDAFAGNPGGIVYANELEGDSWRTLRGYKFDSKWQLGDYNAYYNLSKLFKFTKLSDGTYSVDGFVDNIEEIIADKDIDPDFRYNPTIPAMYNGKPVTTIGRWAFSENELTSVVIPDSVTKIGDAAFQNNQLTSVVIPDSVTTIGVEAFAYNELTSVVIPDSVTSIGGLAFAWNQLTSVEIPDSVTEIGVGAFNGNLLPDNQAFIYERNEDGTENKTKIVGYGGANKDPIVSNHVTTIGDFAFFSNKLTSVDIPDSVTEIGYDAFRYNQLTSIVIPDSVTKIGDSAFYENQLTSVVIPDSVTEIGPQAFQDNQLTSVVIPDSVTEIGYDVFAGNPGGIVYANELEGDSWRILRGYKFDSKWQLGDYNAYRNSSKLFKFTKLSDDTYSVGGFVDNIDEVITENGIKPEFRYNPTMPSMYNGKPVAEIGDQAFSRSALTSVVIPDSVTKIGHSAFWGNQLTSIELPDSIVKIDNAAFRDNQIESVVIPDSMTEIGIQAFRDNQLTSLVIPDSVNRVGSYAFYGNELTSAVIPDSVTEIGYYAFGGNVGGIVYANELEGDSWPTLRSYEFNSLWSRKPLSEYKK